MTLYDIASGRLLAVQRLQAGEGPVTCLTSWLDSELLSAAVLAAPGPRVPDGGGVLPGPDVGIPWRQQDQQDHPHGEQSGSLLCGERAVTRGYLHSLKHWSPLPGRD